MAAPKLLAGVATIKNANGTISTAAIGAATNKLQSVSLRDQFDKASTKDGKGFIIGKGGNSRERMVTVELYFIGDNTPSTLAQAKTNTKLPVEMFEVFTFANTDVAFLDGDWNYEDGTYDGRVGEYHKLTVTVSQVQKSDGTFGALAVVSDS